jgi:hypothetical protein
VVIVVCILIVGSSVVVGVLSLLKIITYATSGERDTSKDNAII